MNGKILAKNLIYVLFLTLLVSGFFAFFTKSAFASSTDGTIDSTYKYAWGENIGWINFGCDNCNVSVTDSGLSGYALSETVGWIYLGDITNNGEGNLSGYAWGENVGYIKFNPTNGGVTINSSGEFSGSALGENIGWIIFGGDYKVKTDWRPRSARPACNNSLDDDGDGKIDYPADPGCSSLDDTNETDTGSGLPIEYSSPPAAPTAVSSENPQGGFRIIINNGAEITQDRTAILQLFTGADTVRMAISNNPEFSGIGSTGQMIFQSSYEWDICRGMEKCVDGEYKVYAKFFTDWGTGSEVVSDGIIYNKEIIIKEPIKEEPSSEKIPPEKEEKPFTEKIVELFKPKPSLPAFPEEIKPPEISIPEDIKPLPTVEEIKEIFPGLEISSEDPDRILEEISKGFNYQIAKNKFYIKNTFKGIYSAFKELRDELKEMPGNIKSFALSVFRRPVFVAKDLSYAMGEGVSIFAKNTFFFGRSVGKLAVLQVGNTGRKIIGLGKFFRTDVVVKSEPSVASPETFVKPENIIVKSAFGNIELPQKDGGIVSLAGLNVKSFVVSDKMVKSVRTEIYLQKMTLKDFDILNNSGKTSFLINEARAEGFVEFEGSRAKFGEYSYVQNRQGVWEAIMVSPAFAGEYELKTTIEYQNGEKSEILNLMVVKVKGWVYYSHPKGQIRLNGAEVKLYGFNDQKGLFELWPAGIYGQRNPQITDASGEYAFLLPEGRYYLEISKDGYLPFWSEEFELKRPDILNQTIALSELEF